MHCWPGQVCDGRIAQLPKANYDGIVWRHSSNVLSIDIMS